MSVDFWKFVHRRLSADERLFLAHVARHSRHSPGTTGARLAVGEDGTTRGTIGGGIMEADVLQQAEKALDAGDYTPRYERLFHRPTAPDDDHSRSSGLNCAGNQTNVYHLVDPAEDRRIVDEIVTRIENDATGRIHISANGLQLDDYTPEQIEPPHRFEGGDSWRFSSLLLNWKRIAIIGGGHCGLALSRVMTQLGYTVTVFENRPDVFTFTNNDHATHRITVDDYAEAGSHIDHRHWTHVVVMTANQPDDVRGLYGVADDPYPYIGVMGAPAKLAHIRSDLEDLGISSKTIDRFYAPIGLDMTSNTPEEIAISVAAEILRERNELFPFTRSPDH